MLFYRERLFSCYTLHEERWSNSELDLTIVMLFSGETYQLFQTVSTTLLRVTTVCIGL
jgi:hypothetical protein